MNTGRTVHWLAALISATALVACDSSSGSSISEAFCSDLDEGLTMMNLWPRDMEPAEFAEKAWGYIATTCPEHYRPNQAYFDNWNLPAIDN